MSRRGSRLVIDAGSSNAVAEFFLTALTASEIECAWNLQ
jgi:hypothetical protein